MALINCKECKAEISSEAEACPHCGYKNKKENMGCGSMIFISIVALVILSGLMSAFGHKASSPNQDRSQTQPSTSTAPSEPGSQWNYSTFADEMGKGVTNSASVASSNTVEFEFPYAGPQHGLLVIRSHPRYGKDVIFSIEKGQVLCRSYDPCTVLVRFDDGKAQTFSGVGAEDNSTEHVFIQNYDRFIQKMLKARTLRISVNIYQQGAPVFEFDVSDFDQSKFKAQK